MNWGWYSYQGLIIQSTYRRDPLQYWVSTSGYSISGDISRTELCSSIRNFVLNRSLQGNKLTGRIPEVIGLMQALTVLDLSDNHLYWNNSSDSRQLDLH